MNDKMRARNYYAAAVPLFQDPTADDCKRAIELLNKAIGLYPKFSDAYRFCCDVWHYRLKSFGWGHNNRTYKKYLDSPAWKVKRDAVIKRDGGQCVCGAQATEVHHKTYDNIGKEPISDLVALCDECHGRLHQPRVPSDHQSATQQPVELLPEDVKEAFIEYITRDSDILQHADFGAREHPDYVGYESGYQKEKGYHQIWLSAWIPPTHNEIAAVIAVRSDSRYFRSHYKKFEKHKNRIEEVFSFEEIKPEKANNGIFHLRVVKKGVDLTQEAGRNTSFRWLRENLEKLYGILRVHDTFRWDTAAFTESLEDKK